MNLSCLLKVKPGDTIELAGGKYVVMMPPLTQEMTGYNLIITNRGHLYIDPKNLSVFRRIIKK